MCDSCVAGTDVDGGGVALLSSTGVRTVVHTTDEASMALETFQIDLAEGPCVDAGRGLSPVLISDLKNAGEGVSERWPFFLPRADAIGIRGVFAFPLRIGSIVLGTLELYRTSPGKLEARELSTALRAAGDMGAAIVDAGGPRTLGCVGAPGRGHGDGAARRHDRGGDGMRGPMRGDRCRRLGLYCRHQRHCGSSAQCTGAGIRLGAFDRARACRQATSGQNSTRTNRTAL